MANLKITINGVDYEVQADGLASESTLQSLVNTLKAMSPIGSANAQAQVLMGPIARAAAAQAAKAAAPTLGPIGAAAARQATALLAASKAADFLSSKFGVVGKLLGNFGLGLATRYPGLVNGLQAMSAGLNIVTGVFSVLASVVGFVVGSIKAVYKSMNELLGGIKDLYASGARYQGNFVQLAVIAGRAGVGIDDFVKFLAKNQMEVYRFGDSLISGASRMKDITKAMFKTGWSIGNLGLSAGDALQYLANYSEVIQYTTKQNLANVKAGETVEQANFRVSEQTKRYILNLDSLARITGKTRDEMNQLALEISKDPRTNAALDQLNLSSEQLASANTILSSLKGMEGVGDNLYTAVLDIMQTGTIVNQEAAQAIAQGAPELQQALFDLASSIKEGTDDPQKSILQFRRSLAASESSISQFNDATFGMVPGVLALQKLARHEKVAMQSLNDEAARRGMSTEAYMKQQDDLAQATVEANKALQSLSNIPQTILTKLFTSKNFVGFWNRIFGETGLLSRITDKIYKLVDDPNMTMTKFFKTVWSVISEEGVELLGLMKDVLTGIFDFFKGKLSDFFETTVQKAIGTMLNRIVPGSGSSLIEAANAAEERKKAAQTAADAQKAANDAATVAAATATDLSKLRQDLANAKTDKERSEIQQRIRQLTISTDLVNNQQQRATEISRNSEKLKSASDAVVAGREIDESKSWKQRFTEQIFKTITMYGARNFLLPGRTVDTTSSEDIAKARFEELFRKQQKLGVIKPLSKEDTLDLTRRFMTVIDDKQDVTDRMDMATKRLAYLADVEEKAKKEKRELTPKEKSEKEAAIKEASWLQLFIQSKQYKSLPATGGPLGGPAMPGTSNIPPTSSAFPEQLRPETQQSTEATDSLKRTADATTTTQRSIDTLVALNRDQLRLTSEQLQLAKINGEMERRAAAVGPVNPQYKNAFTAALGYPIT